jgi:hypothetical protein
MRAGCQLARPDRLQKAAGFKTGSRLDKKFKAFEITGDTSKQRAVKTCRWEVLKKKGNPERCAMKL